MHVSPFGFSGDFFSVHFCFLRMDGSGNHLPRKGYSEPQAGPPLHLIYLVLPARAQDARYWVLDPGVDAGGVIVAGVRPELVTCFIGPTLNTFTRSFPRSGCWRGPAQACRN